MVEYWKIEMTLNVLVIGLGNIGMLYDYQKDNVTWTHVKAIKSDDRFNLVGGIDVDECNREIFSELTGRPVFQSIEMAVDSINTEIHIIVVACPTEFHLELYRKIKRVCNQIGCKMVLMEKPIAFNSDELNTFEQAAVTGPKIMVNLFRLYQNQLNTCLQRMAQQGDCDIHIIYSKGLVHNGIHFYSLLLKHFKGDSQFDYSSSKLDSSIKMKLNGATVTFSPAKGELDNNSMTVYSSVGTLYYLNGGRNSFYTAADHSITVFDEYEFNHYQCNVYERLYSLITRKIADDSFALAMESQKQLEIIEKTL